ncbi:MAG: alpha-ketoacid dehydrogenase subunit beta [Planctomycetota bacterium]
MTYREAVREALREALHADPRVFLLGEDVGRYGGAYACSRGLLEEFGPDRIRDAPLSENTFVGAGIGAAVAGLRPIVEVMTINFALLALDQIVNHAATLRHMSAGQLGVPLVIRMATGAGRQLAAQHSHSLEVWFAHVPGLKLLAPATVTDARRMLAAALADPDPVIICEHAQLYPQEGPLEQGPEGFDAWHAACRRSGDDVTLVTSGGSLPKCLAATDELAAEGIAGEVFDLRCLRPLDLDPVVASVRKTRRLAIVDEGWRTCGLAAEIAAAVTERAFADLEAPPVRIGSAEVPIPYARHLEEAALPGVGRIVAAVRGLVRRATPAEAVT